MMLHMFLFTCRHHGVGALVLLLHDVTDVELEFTKLNVYFKNRGGKLHRLNDIAADLGFVAFASSWYDLTIVLCCHFTCVNPILLALQVFLSSISLSPQGAVHGLLWCRSLGS